MKVKQRHSQWRCRLCSKSQFMSCASRMHVRTFWNNAHKRHLSKTTLSPQIRFCGSQSSFNQKEKRKWDRNPYTRNSVCQEDMKEWRPVFSWSGLHGGPALKGPPANSGLQKEGQCQEGGHEAGPETHSKWHSQCCFQQQEMVVMPISTRQGMPSVHSPVSLNNSLDLWRQACWSAWAPNTWCLSNYNTDGISVQAALLKIGEELRWSFTMRPIKPRQDVEDRPERCQLSETGLSAQICQIKGTMTWHGQELYQAHL